MHERFMADRMAQQKDSRKRHQKHPHTVVYEQPTLKEQRTFEHEKELVYDFERKTYDQRVIWHLNLKEESEDMRHADAFLYDDMLDLY